MHNEMIQHTEECFDELSPGTALLRGQYVIEGHLVRGGFGVTYLARDSLDRQVVIKECLPVDISCRIDGVVQARTPEQQPQYASILRHFLREARRLAKLSHPNIVGVHQVFEENDTAYMALDFIHGMDLLSIIEDDPERLSPEAIRAMLMKSLEAISYIHDQGILHRDISPDNFLLDWENNITLIDFGAARDEATKGNRALSALLAVKDGYSPQEFYLSDLAHSPASDLYSLGATFYHLIAGQAPPNSQSRLAAIAAETQDPYRPLTSLKTNFDQNFLAAIDQALEVFPEQRIQSARDWLEFIDETAAAAGARKSGDNNIHRTISKLVEDTNKKVRPGKGGAKKNRAQGAAGKARMRGSRAGRFQVAQDENKGPPKPVDLFGNPIEDVEAWLEAQNKQPEPEPEPEKVKPVRPRVARGDRPRREAALRSTSLDSGVIGDPMRSKSARFSPTGKAAFRPIPVKPAPSAPGPRPEQKGSGLFQTLMDRLAPERPGPSKKPRPPFS